VQSAYDSAVSSLWNQVTRPLRELRWQLAQWSPSSDRRFHDDLFAPQQHDPFSPSYPGYLTIRRFADLAMERFDGARSVLDLGCGPAEITCELARRRPDVRFKGVDHSAAGLDRARANAQRLGLTNITFESGDLERFTPATPVDLVVMFDAFHHILDPTAFLVRVRPFCGRMFLIEPAGRWTGQWDRGHDLDWLASTFFQMADRLEHEFAIDVSSAPDPLPRGSQNAGTEPTEHRYTMEDFERLFAGYAIDVRGTIAGLEQYGAHSRARSTLRDRMADAAYEMVTATERALVAEGLDLAAKHWAIYAVHGAPPLPHRSPPRLPPRPPSRGLMPPYAVGVEDWSGPTIVRRGERFQIALRLTNRGWQTWSSDDREPVLASYHWLDPDGRVLLAEGLRTRLPATVLRDETVDVALSVEAPDRAGNAVLAVDLVHEGVTWFSEQGVAPLKIRYRVEG
jgi:SAM-dependent methyltransferase